MLKDCLDVFKNIYDKKGEEYILDSYLLVEGTYLLVNKNGEIVKKLDVKRKDNDLTSEDYKYFKPLDYFSKLIDMNKPIDSKKIIHSNNYLSFFIKKDNIGNGKLKETIIDGFYDVLKDPTTKYKKEKLQMYNQMEEKYGKVNEEELEKYRTWIKNNIFTVLESFDIKKDKNYLKIFFENSIDKYKNENEKYLIPNIYNNTDYSVEIDKIIHGLPNNNMNLNSKKPFLENRSRKNSIPYLIDTDEVLIQKKFFDYLENKLAEGKNNIYIQENYIDDFFNDDKKEEFKGYLLRIKKGKEVEIINFDILTGFNKKINDIYVDNTLNINYPEKYKMMGYGVYNRLDKVMPIIDSVYFNNYLSRNFFTDPSDIKINDSKVKFNLLKYRQAFFNWFYKGNDEIIKKIFYNLSIELIKNSVSRDRTIRAKEQFNLMYSILNYLKGGNSMTDKFFNLTDNLRSKLDSDITQKIDNDYEYYFGAGQLISYLISLNKSKQRKHSLINPILNVKSDERLKDEIRKLFKKYNYAINKNDKRFNNLSSMILGYKPQGNIKEDTLLYGYLHSNLMYESKK